jgi:hypothetical protein
LGRTALRGTGRSSFFEALDRTAAEAGEAHGYSDRFYEIGGLPVRLRFAGSDGLARLATALSHLSAPPSEDVALSIAVWASGPMSDASWRQVAGGPSGRAVAVDAAGWFRSYDRALTAFDRESSRGYHWLEDPDRDLWYERSYPLRPLFGAWLDRHGVQLTHGAAVGSKDGCVLLVGRSGSGKSHVALACVQAGIGYIGDDACLLRNEEPPTVQSIYSSARVGPATLKQLPFLAQLDDDPITRSGPRARLFLGSDLPQALVREAPLRAIAIVSRAGGPDPHVRPASPGEALAAFAANSLLPVPGIGHGALKRLSVVVQRVPCVRLEAGRDPARVAEVVGALL